MEKITYDMLDGFSESVKGMYRLLYPNGLTLTQLEEKAKSFNWLMVILKSIKEV